MKMELEINNDILIWAVERAGLNLDDISRKVPQFSAWIHEGKKPTLKQLQNFSAKVYLPFGYLFLTDPPEEKLPIPFFRTIQQEEEQISLNVYDTILILQKRQEWLTDFLKENDYSPLPFVGKFKGSNNVEVIVNDIRRVLGLNENWASEFVNWEKAKDHLTKTVEDAGIIPIFNSVVGNNNYRKIKVDECRGFVLVNDYVPFMYVNSADSKAAQIFTIAHELAHIWIGVSAGFDFRQLQPSNEPIEILCDKIAAEFLVPEKAFLELLIDGIDIKYLAKQFKVSQIVIARRLLDLGKLDRTEFFQFYEEYISRDFQKKKDNDGGDFYKTQRKRLSVRFLTYVNQAVKENRLLIRDAYQLTSLKGNTYNKFMAEHLI